MSNQRIQIPRWNPTKAQMELFQEWRKFTIQHLVSCKKGIQPSKLPGMLQERVDERLPLDRMGVEIRNVGHFLYQLRNDIVLRKVDGKLFVFINEFSVPPAMSHIRKMVLGQKGKDDKPLRHHGMGVQAEELLRFQPRPPVSAPSSFNPGYQNRAPRGRSSSGPSNKRRGPQAPPRPRSGISSIQSNVPNPMASTSFSNAAPTRVLRVDNWNVSRSVPTPTTSRVSQPTTFHRNLPGIDNKKSSCDSGGLNYYSGARKSPPLPLFAANKTLATQEGKKTVTTQDEKKTVRTQEEKKTVTTQQEKKTLMTTSTSATVVSQPENSTASVLMRNPPGTDTVPKPRVWGKNQLRARMNAIMEKYSDPNKEVEVPVLQPQNVVLPKTPATWSVSMQSNPPTTDTVPNRRFWGKDQLNSRMNAIIERVAIANKQVSMLQPNIAKRDVSVLEPIADSEVLVTMSEPNIALSNSSQTESVCNNVPKISEEPEPSSTCTQPRCRPLSKASSGTEHLPDFINSLPDMEVNYGYTIEQIHLYEQGHAGVSPGSNTFKQVVRFPSCLIGPPRTLKIFLEETGQLEYYMKSLGLE